jgi:hypothetical protein
MEGLHRACLCLNRRWRKDKWCSTFLGGTVPLSTLPRLRLSSLAIFPTSEGMIPDNELKPSEKMGENDINWLSLRVSWYKRRTNSFLPMSRSIKFWSHPISVGILPWTLLDADVGRPKWKGLVSRHFFQHEKLRPLTEVDVPKVSEQSDMCW